MGNHNNMNQKKILLPLVFIVVVVSSFLFRNHAVQSINWTYPYASGAANISFPLQWRISASEYDSLVKLGPREYMAHRHQRTPETIINEYNSFGYVLVVFIARNVFFFAGDMDATVWLQILVHALIVVSIFSMLDKRKRILFLLLYGVNPFVLHFVTFPFYYFWTVVPCYFFCWAYLGKKQAGYWLLPATIALYLSFLIRPTTVFVIAGFYLWLFIRAGKRMRVFTGTCFLLFVCGAIAFNGKPKHAVKDESTLWHTAYIGFGAYTNPDSIKLSDESGYEAYFKATGKSISTNPVAGTYTSFEERNAYFGFQKQRYIETATKHKFLTLKNAFFNTLLSYGAGYFIGHWMLTLISMLFGTCVIGFILYRRYYLLGLCILLYAGAYVVFYPPIAAYHFGAFLPLFIVFVFGASEILQRFGKKKEGDNGAF